jgi:hypothetical protein
MTALGDACRCDLCGTEAGPDELNDTGPAWRRFVSPRVGCFVDICTTCLDRPIRDLIAATYDAELRKLMDDS